MVGETWEGCTEPASLIAASPHADRITFVNEYVPDEVVGAASRMPTWRSSPTGARRAAGSCTSRCSYGLPLVVTSVGGLPEAASGYFGAVSSRRRTPASSATGLMKAVHRWPGQHFPDPRSWHDTVAAVREAAAVDEDKRATAQ